MLGEAATAKIRFETKTPGVYNGDQEACKLATLSVHEENSLIKLTDKVATILTHDDENAIRADKVGKNDIKIYWKTHKSNIQMFETYSVEVLPACKYSPILFQEESNPIMVERGSSSTLYIPPSFVYHEYESLWTERGYPDACTIGLMIHGSAAEYSTLNDSSIVVSPDLTHQANIDML